MSGAIVTKENDLKDEEEILLAGRAFAAGWMPGEAAKWRGG